MIGITAVTSITTWCANVWSSIYPFIPGFAAIASYTLGSHVVTFGGSWWTARSYSVNCVGEGFKGFIHAYWTFGSPTCTTLLFSHVILLAAAVASLISTFLIFGWVWYRTFKKMLMPITDEIKEELKK